MIKQIEDRLIDLRKLREKKIAEIRSGLPTWIEKRKVREYQELLRTTMTNRKILRDFKRSTHVID